MGDMTKVIISRHWDNPEITVHVDDEKIEVQMSIEDFCKSLVAEIPHPLLTLTRSQLEKNCLKTINTVVDKAKEATAYL